MAKVKPLDRRSYGQYCGLARALDAVGDRWSLLIVRELLTGPQRYHELLAGLPGIATNLLATRLRTLESSGVVERRISTRANAIAYALTPWGAQLREPVEALMRWSAPLMVSGRGGDTFQAHWLANALQALLRPGTAAEPARRRHRSGRHHRGGDGWPGRPFGHHKRGPCAWLRAACQRRSRPRHGRRRPQRRSGHRHGEARGRLPRPVRHLRPEPPAAPPWPRPRPRRTGRAPARVMRLGPTGVRRGGVAPRHRLPVPDYLY